MYTTTEVLIAAIGMTIVWWGFLLWLVRQMYFEIKTKVAYSGKIKYPKEQHPTIYRVLLGGQILISLIFFLLGAQTAYKLVSVIEMKLNPIINMNVVCEDGTHFGVVLINPNKLEITSENGEKSTFTMNYSSNDTYVYGDDKYGYTFVGGYGGQIIYTSRSAEPTSVICKSQNTSS